MSKVADLHIELQDHVFDALSEGAQTVGDVMDYLKTHHADFPLPYDEELITQLVEDSYFDVEDDGQPTELEEWLDFDPDC